MNKTKILQCLNYAETARLDKDALHKVYPDAYYLEDKETDTQGFVLLSDGELVISFRGTQQLKDWLTDVNAFHMVYPYDNPDTKLMVHRGFMMAYLSVRESIHYLVQNYAKDIKKITVTGHSLGGALALLCAVDMQYNFRYLVQAYVSGNPMVGNKYFVSSYNKRVPETIRTFMRKDVVPKLPPEWFESKTYDGFAHAGKPFPIGPNNPLLGIFTWFKKLFHKADSLLDDLVNHDIGLYRTEIEKLNK